MTWIGNYIHTKLWYMTNNPVRYFNFGFVKPHWKSWQSLVISPTWTKGCICLIMPQSQSVKRGPGRIKDENRKWNQNNMRNQHSIWWQCVTSTMIIVVIICVIAMYTICSVIIVTICKCLTICCAFIVTFHVIPVLLRANYSRNSVTNIFLCKTRYGTDTATV